MADHRFVRGDLVLLKTYNHLHHQGAGEVRGYVNGEVLVKFAGPEGSYSQRWPENKLAFYSAPKKMATKRGQARTRPSSRTARWAEVRAAEKAGHPMKHPRRYVFGE